MLRVTGLLVPFSSPNFIQFFPDTDSDVTPSGYLSEPEDDSIEIAVDVTDQTRYVSNIRKV